jgi:hypothetical protein
MKLPVLSAGQRFSALAAALGCVVSAVAGDVLVPGFRAGPPLAPVRLFVPASALSGLVAWVRIADRRALLDTLRSALEPAYCADLDAPSSDQREPE